jgi:hypothetical protein
MNVWIVFLFAMVGWFLAVAALLELVGVGRAGILILQAPAYTLAFVTAYVVAEW